MWQERVIKTFFPAFRVEVGCVFSLIAYILLYRTGHHVEFWEEIRAHWKRMEYVDAAGMSLMFLAILLILAIPIASVCARKSLFHRFPRLSIQGSAVVLLSIYGWMAKEHLEQLHAGGALFGVPVNALCAIVELAELAILMLFVFSVMDLTEELKAILGPKEPSYGLLTLVCVLGIPTVFLNPWLSQPNAALLGIHLCFLASLLWGTWKEGLQPDGRPA